jgi:hypothetical protein
VVNVVINRQNGNFSSKMSPGGHLEFPIFTEFLPRHPLTYTNPYAKSQKNPSTFATFRARTIKVYGLGRGGGPTPRP